MKKLILILIAILSLTSCKKEEIKPTEKESKQYICEIYMREGSLVTQDVYINGVKKSYQRPTSYIVKTGDVIKCHNISQALGEYAYVIIYIDGESVINTIPDAHKSDLEVTYVVH